MHGYELVQYIDLNTALCGHVTLYEHVEKTTNYEKRKKNDFYYKNNIKCAFHSYIINLCLLW